MNIPLDRPGRGVCAADRNIQWCTYKSKTNEAAGNFTYWLAETDDSMNPQLSHSSNFVHLNASHPPNTHPCIPTFTQDFTQLQKALSAIVGLFCVCLEGSCAELLQHRSLSFISLPPALPCHDSDP
eukprot:1145068-Pelagomonas_calceolata.AAC.4